MRLCGNSRLVTIGFPPKWTDLIMKTVTIEKVGINVNGEIGAYFSTLQGVRQGDPLSPILFDLDVDVLAVLVKRAQKESLLTGLGTDLVEGGSHSAICR
jgi:hypothetical protein